MSTVAERRAARKEARRAARTELKNPAYEIFIGLLSILSIVNLVLYVALHDDPSLQLVLQVMNGLFSVIFLGDFVYRIVTAPSAMRYFFRGFGWADLLASLPFPQLKILRLFRLLRVIRLLHELGPRTVWNLLTRDRADSTLMTLLMLGVLVLQWASIGILAIEEDAEGANITSASDALWYTIVTISTVGYGDQYPVTPAGRWLGALVIIVGVGIFGTFTGYLANLFLGPSGRSAGDADADADHDDTDADDRTDAASRGVAAGAASGAVAAGMDAADDARADDAADARADAAAADAADDARADDAAADPLPVALPVAAGAESVHLEPAAAARLEALLAQSEQMMNEIRALLATADRR